MTETKRKAPAIVGKAKEEPKPYLFKSVKSPGQSVKCFMGNCPDKRKGEWFKDTVREHNLTDGQVVHLTESEYQHLSERGVEKPITTTNAQTGYQEFTGQSYIDRRFELHPC